MNETTPSRRQRFSRGQIAAAGVVLLAAVGFGAWKMNSAGAKEGEWIYAAVHTGDIEDLVTATGTLEPRDKVDVGAQVSGQIVKINVEVGDQVKADQILA
jgi:membrane fusion protein, macrolide-specific efflux system